MTGRAPRFLFTFTLVRDLLLRAKHLFVAAIPWPSLNPVAPHDDKRVIAMTNEGRPGPPHCGVSGRRLAARAYARRAPPDEMPERILTCFWCCRDWRFLVAPSGLAAGQGRARRHHWGHSRLRSGQQIQLDPRLLRLAGGIPATGAAMTAPVDYGQRFFLRARASLLPSAATRLLPSKALLNADVSARDQWTSNPQSPAPTGSAPCFEGGVHATCQSAGGSL